MENREGTIHIDKYFGSLAGMIRKFERVARSDCFKGETVDDFEEWKEESRERLSELIGLYNMEMCDDTPGQGSDKGFGRVEFVERVKVCDGIEREKIVLEVEPDTWMPVFILIPETVKGVWLALAGHQGAGKFSIAGMSEILAVSDSIKQYNYDYGLKLAKKGYVTVCPDPRGFGERRDEALQNDSRQAFLNSTCFHLAHMAEPLGQTVAGMCTWDYMCLIDYLNDRNEWDMCDLGCIGFSGGGMQTLWLSALDTRVKKVIISGYMYGYRDSLLILNDNCSCNYVPNLYRHYDMGDIASLIVPRPLIIQSCRGDHLNGPRGMENVYEQVDIIQNAYALYGLEVQFTHDIREGEHCFHPEILEYI